MNILLVNLGNQCDCFISTCILKTLRKNKQQEAKIDVLVAEKKCIPIFKHNPIVRRAITVNNIKPILSCNYDKLINLSPNFNIDINAKEVLGLENNKDCYEFLYGNKHTKKNIFQIYHKLAGLSWKGTGCDLPHYPRNRSKKKKTGIAVAHNNLRRYVQTRLSLDEGRLSELPFKENIFKKLDEINKCGSIITDDFLTLNVALYLRKYVYFLKTIPYNTKIELFGKGKVFRVPPNFIQ